MNETVRSQLEQYFDGELISDRHAEVERLLAEDGEARRYLNRLSRLRTLARSHEPAVRGAAFRGFVAPSRTRVPRVWAVASVSLAASVAAMLILWSQSVPEAPGARNNEVIVAPTPFATSADRSPKTQEIELYTWANRERRRPESVVSTLLVSRTHARNRPAAREILALDLANALPAEAEELEPLAILHKSAPGGRIRNEQPARRPRPSGPGM